MYLLNFYLKKKKLNFLFSRSNEESEVQLDKIFKILASKENDHVRSKTLTIKGRNVKFYKTCGQVTDCTFEELCDRVNQFEIIIFCKRIFLFSL